MKRSDQNESRALQALMMDGLRPFVPEFRRVIEKDSESILSWLCVCISVCLCVCVYLFVCVCVCVLCVCLSLYGVCVLCVCLSLYGVYVMCYV